MVSVGAQDYLWSGVQTPVGVQGQISLFETMFSIVFDTYYI